MDNYGDYRVMRQHARGNVLRVWAQHRVTGEKKFVTIPLTKNGR